MKKSVINWKLTTKVMARVAIFGAVATILYVVPFFVVKIPIFPPFLEFHFDEIPIFIAGFAYGPLTSVLIIVVKTLIKLPFSQTAMVGELADVFYSLAFILPAVLVYRKHRNLKGVMIGFGLGFIAQLIVSSLFNALFMIDFYLFLYPFMTPESLLATVQAVNPRITDIHWTMVLYGILPFNLVKNILVIIITFLTYKRVHQFFYKF
ncbi:MAG: ECF transporter S component [Bacilli bacterium]